MTWKPSPTSDQRGNRWGARCRPRLLGALCLAAVVVLVPIAVPRVSQAAPASSPKAAARKKLVEGAELLKKGDFQAALDRFQAAYDLVPSPKIQYNFALAYMGLGRNAEALQALLTFLSEASEASPETITNARNYKEALVQKICRVTVHADVAGAAIVVDGHPYGTTPRNDEVLLDAGLHSLVVEKPGTGKAYTQWFEAPAGKSLTIEAKLLAPKPAKPAPRAPIAMEASDGAKTGGNAKSGSLAGMVAADSAAPGSGARALKWSGIAVGSLAAVALGFGVFEWVVKEQKFRKFNSDGCDKKFVVDYGGPGCRPLFDDGSSAKRLGYIGLAAAGALGVGAAVLLLLSGQGPDHPGQGPEQPAKGPEKIFACAPTLTAAGGSCILRF